MVRSSLTPLLIVFLAIGFQPQAGGHTLFGDIRVDETEARNSKPLSLQVSLYTEAGELLFRQTVSSNGRYRFNNLRDGRYDVVVEFENTEAARVRVYVSSPFKTDFRKDIELQLREKLDRPRPGVVSVADNYKRSNSNVRLLKKATEANSKKQYGEAISLLQQIVDSDPADYPAWSELGATFFLNKDLDHSEQSYLKALSQKQDYLPALINLGRLRIARQNFEGAVAVLSQALKLEPSSAPANFFLGEAYLQLRLGSKAVPYLQEALRLDPVGMADAHLRLAALYGARNMKGKAASEYEAFLKVRPDYPERKKLKDYIAANKEH